MDLVIKLINTVISIVVGWFLNKYWYKIIERRPYYRVFGLKFNEKVYIIIPHRPLPAQLGLSVPKDRTHVTFEDMLAANYAERSLTLAGFSDKMISILSVDQYNRDKAFLEKQNLILICSPKANGITKDLLCILNEGTPKLDVDFKKIRSDPDEWGILFNKALLSSDSYKQTAQYILESKDPEQEKLEDYGILARVNSPWGKDKKIFIIAGIRGIGTWGAARCLRDRAEKIVRKTKGKDFALIVKVTYNNYKMVNTELTNFFSSLSS